MKRVCMLVIAGAAAAVLGGASVAQASDYTLSQTIEPMICTSTTTTSGPSTTITSTCDESYAPILTEVVFTANTSILRGKYDAMYTKNLRIHVFGRWFEASNNRYLLTSGNTWQLNLTEFTPDITPGSYEVIIEATARSDIYLYETISSRAIIVVPERPVAVNQGIVPATRALENYGNQAGSIANSGTTTTRSGTENRNGLIVNTNNDQVAVDGSFNPDKMPMELEGDANTQPISDGAQRGSSLHFAGLLVLLLTAALLLLVLLKKRRRKPNN